MHLLSRISLRVMGRELSSLTNACLDVSSEVESTLMQGGPVVALESTIITHGMPWPHNLDTACAVEKIVREQGAVPATIAIIGGRLKVGLSPSELSDLAKMTALKTSRRDMAFVLSQGLNGGTTVSGTIIAAKLAGIHVFATGGIGGVHRDGHTTLDVSADLTELGRNPVAVVSSGVKSILDIPRTLEYLETQGVCVATLGSDRLFPAFYTRSYNGNEAPHHVTSPEQAALLIRASLDLGLGSGVLIGVPVPEEDAMDAAVIDAAITEALREATKAGVVGKQLTPFILSAVARITEGKSLQTNMSLIKNNALKAAQIAVALSEIGGRNAKSEARNQTVFLPKKTKSLSKNIAADHRLSPVIIGGSILDICIRVAEDDIKMDGSTHVATTSLSGGGVGRNIADSLCKMGARPQLITSVGADQHGSFLSTLLPDGVMLSADSPPCPTATYSVVLDADGECRIGLGDMDAHLSITSEQLIRHEEAIARAPMLIVDGNVPTDTIGVALELAHKYRVPVFFEPTDIRKAGKPFLTGCNLSSVMKFASPNMPELRAMAALVAGSSGDYSAQDKKNLSEDEVISEVCELARSIVPHISTLLVTLGSIGAVVVHGGPGVMMARHYRPSPVQDIVNVSGAGDCLAGGFIRALLDRQKESVCMSVAMAAARLALASPSAVPAVMFDKSHPSWQMEATWTNISI